MIEESYVSFNTAKMLKEAGFEEMVNSCFMYDDKADEYEYEFVNGYAIVKKALRDNYNGYENTISRPTQALAVRWLREVHGIHVVITEEAYTNGINYLWQVLIYNPLSIDCWDNKSTGMYGDNGEYKTYEEALEAGLREAIKLIKK